MARVVLQVMVGVGVGLEEMVIMVVVVVEAVVVMEARVVVVVEDPKAAEVDPEALEEGPLVEGEARFDQPMLVQKLCQSSAEEIPVFGDHSLMYFSHL